MHVIHLPLLTTVVSRGTPVGGGTLRLQSTPSLYPAAASRYTAPHVTPWSSSAPIPSIAAGCMSLLRQMHPNWAVLALHLLPLPDPRSLSPWQQQPSYIFSTANAPTGSKCLPGTGTSLQATQSAGLSLTLSTAQPNAPYAPRLQQPSRPNALTPPVFPPSLLYCNDPELPPPICTHDTLISAPLSFRRPNLTDPSPPPLQKPSAQRSRRGHVTTQHPPPVRY